MAPELSNLFQIKEKIRGPIVDGIFYPDDENLLSEEIRYLLDEVDGNAGNSFGIIAPHAALPFSGALAAAAFKSAAKRKIDNVVIIAPVHRDEKDAVFLTESESFTIPTGNIKVNRSIVNKLKNYDPCFQLNDLPHLEEHCIEVQLPFIHFLFPEASIIPVLIGSNSEDLLKKVIKAVNYVFKDKLAQTLFVISANMTCYLPAAEAHDICDEFLISIEEGNIDNIFMEVKKYKQKSKGLGCIAILLSLAGENSIIKVLRKKDSSKYGCDNDNIVCYAAITVDKTG